MIWHIAKRELYDNLNSLRFAFATLLILILMTTNASLHLRKYPERMQTYRESVTASRDILMSRAPSLYQLASEGPGLLHKKPSPLSFCVDGGDTLLPSYVEGHRRFWSIRDIKSIWRLTYPDANPNLTNIHPDVVKIDWAFIVGYVLSFTALLFTFDSVSGEHEKGTLRLMLTNSIPRHAVLMGKFLGAFLSIHIPFALSIVINLLVMTTSTQVQFESSSWGRLGFLCLIMTLYACLFLALGLLVSAGVRESSISLVILLLIWVSFVVFIPNILSTIAGGFSSPMSAKEFKKRQKEIRTELNEDFRLLKQQKNDIWPERETPVSMSTMWWSDRLLKDANQNERLNEEYLSDQIAQVRLARTISRISPTVILYHLFESFAGTGFDRHLQFLENARRYTREYREFIIDTDKADPESPHIIGIRAGMSEKSVSPEAIPIFEDTLSFSRDFNKASSGVLLLVLFLVVLLSGTHLIFVRKEV